VAGNRGNHGIFTSLNKLVLCQFLKAVFWGYSKNIACNVQFPTLATGAICIPRKIQVPAFAGFAYFICRCWKAMILQRHDLPREINSW
jgi:hypothetical protein